MEINIQKIIDNALNYFVKDSDKELRELVIGVSLKTAFNVSFEKYFPNFPVDGDKPEVLSYDDECYRKDGQVVIAETDTSAFLDEEETLYFAMSTAEFWVNKNIDECRSRRSRICRAITTN